MINEALNKEENKVLFKQLMKKYHPDVGGDEEKAKGLLNARVSDSAFESFVKELTGKAVERREYVERKGGRNYIPENILRIKNWLVEPEFMTLLNKYQAVCKVEQSTEEKDKNHFIVITVVAIQKDREKLNEVSHFKSDFGSRYNDKDKDYLYDYLKDVIEYWYKHSLKR